MTPNESDVIAAMPIPYRAVRVWTDDGNRQIGMWTGSQWWGLHGEIQAVRWELEERPKKTKKLLKVVPGRF